MNKIPVIFLCCLFALSAAGQSGADIPVKINLLEATRTNQHNKLYWTTACFLAHADFNIQRSYNGTDYVTIHTFQADRLRCLQPFNFIDSASYQLAGKVYYRLKVGDLDGRVYNSKIVVVFSSGSGIAINSFTPTLVRNIASISLSSSAAMNAGIVVVNAGGVAFYKKSVSLLQGINTISLPTQQLPQGKYYLLLHTPKYETKTVQFIKQ